MIYFPRWQIIAILGACLLAFLLALPNAIPAKQIAKWPHWLPARHVALGLDLQGGSHLLFQGDITSSLHDRLADLTDSIQAALNKAKIAFTNLKLEGDAINLTLQNDTDSTKARETIAEIDADLAIDAGAGGRMSAKYSTESFQKFQSDKINSAINIIRRRIDETGTKEPNIQREGADRILVQLPGVQDPERMKDYIGKTAKMTFRLVDTEPDREVVKSGRAPPGDDLLPLVNNGQTVNMLPIRKRVMVNGDNLISANQSYDEYGGPAIAFRFDAIGGKRFGDATRTNIGKPFAIVLDNQVISAPVIQTEIAGGRGIITGKFTSQEAIDLSNQLNAGALPLPLTVIEERTVGPDLGADSIRAGSTASLIAIALVVVFMIAFYGLFGLFADIALFANLAMMLACLTMLGATLTLPGIAGIALTMGMAVDANVLIYERIREESRNKRSMVAAIDNGFRRAFLTILDSHITTLIAGILLFFLGSGPVQGFAVTLCLGVITSLFTALLVTRLIVAWWLKRYKPVAVPI